MKHASSLRHKKRHVTIIYVNETSHNNRRRIRALPSGDEYFYWFHNAVVEYCRLDLLLEERYHASVELCL